MDGGMPGDATKAAFSAEQHLLSAVRGGGAAAFADAATLPPEAYVTPAMFDLEFRHVLRAGWNCVGHVSQLPNNGDYFTIDLLREMLVVTRLDDTIRVLSRICPHRWAPVVEGSGNARLLSCPFHKWAFALDGRLLGAPLMDGVNFDPKSCGLTSFRTEIIGGFIFVTFAEATPPLAPAVAALAATLDRHQTADLVLAESLTYDCAINWKIVVETFMECYHHIAAHSETFEKTYPARLSYCIDGGPGWSLCGAKMRPEMPDSANVAGFPELGNVHDDERRDFRLYNVFPTFLINVFPDRVYWFLLQPIDVARTIMTTRLLVRPAVLDDPRYRPALEHERRFLDIANQEDIRVNEMQQKGAATPSARPGRMSHLEESVWHLARHVRERLAAAG